MAFESALEVEDTSMSNSQTSASASSGTPGVAPGDMSLEVVVIPVSDVDRAKEFYATTLGFQLHADFTAPDGLRIVQVTPPGSRCSINFGTKVTAATPGSTQGGMLVVPDIVAARADLVSRGVDVSEVFHDVGGVFHHAGTDGRLPGPAPERQSYASFASFSDPDGNGWILQEISTRFEGR